MIKTEKIILAEVIEDQKRNYAMYSQTELRYINLFEIC